MKAVREEKSNSIHPGNTEEELHFQKIRFEQLFKNLPLGIVMLDTQNRIISINKGFEELFNYSINEIKGEEIDDLIVPDNLKNEGNYISNETLKGKICEKESIRKRKDGTFVHVRIQGVPIKSDEQLIGIYGIYEDISDRKLTEEALREKDKLLECVTNAATLLLTEKETDKGIEKAFEIIGKSVGVSRIYIFENSFSVSNNEPIMTQHYEWTDGKVAAQIGNPLLQNLPYSKIDQQLYYTLGEGKVINSHVKDLNDSQKNFLSGFDAISILIVPIFVKSNFWGFIGFDECNKERLWTELEISILSIAGSAFGNALARQASEMALRHSEKKYRKIFENIQDIFYQTDANGIITTISPSIERFSGYKPEELIGRPVTEAYAVPEDREKILKEIYEKGEVFDFEVKLKSKTGRIVFTSVNSRLMRDKNGSVIGVEGSLRDITERKLAVDQLRKLSRALEQSPSVVIITDTNGVIEYVNPKFTEITGYTFEEVKGKNPRLLKSGEKSHEEYKELWKTLTSGKEWRGEFHNRKKNGELYWESASISPIKNLKGDITNYVAVKEDITEKKKVLDELVKAKHEAEKADRLKSEFLAQISHEIRSPLYVLLSFSDVLREKFGDRIDPETAESFNAIESSGKRIIRTIDMVLNMSEIQTGSYEYRPQKIDLLKNVLYDLEKEYKSIAERKKLNMKINSLTDNTQIVADQYSITQIFANLIDNAIKYTQKGNIGVSVHRDEDGKLIVDVSDTGIGISENYMSNLFLPFSQEETGYSRSYEGNGLGLALVKKYCEINKAEIFVKSSKGKGTTFSVRFHE